MFSRNVRVSYPIIPCSDPHADVLDRRRADVRDLDFDDDVSAVLGKGIRVSISSSDPSILTVTFDAIVPYPSLPFVTIKPDVLTVWPVIVGF